MIIKEGSYYVVRSEKTGRSFGKYKTKREAIKRLKQVEFFKHAKEHGVRKKTHPPHEVSDSFHDRVK